MITIEKYFDDGEEAARTITATSDGRDYKIGIMYDMDNGHVFEVTIRGALEFKKFAESLIDVLSGMVEDVDDVHGPSAPNKDV